MGAVKKKLKLVPPLTPTLNTGVPVAPVPVVYVGAVKSDVMPAVAPLLPDTVTVHEITSPIRTTVVYMLVWPLQAKLDVVAGTPNTENVNGLPPTGAVPLTSFSVTCRVVVDALGAVKKNVKLVPPPTVTSAGVPVAPTPVVKIGVVRSLLKATAVPNASRTVTVHEITSLTRTYVVVALV